MAASIESRTPLLDYRLVELVLRIPEHLRFRAGEQKPLLREAVAPWLPWAIVNRRDKRGFPTPLHHWRDRPRLRTLVEELLDAPSTVPVFSPSYLRRAPSLAPSEIWTVLMVKGWVDRTMSGRQALAA
jgi:asparagine synthase (glutamine-hydrolysing)